MLMLFFLGPYENIKQTRSYYGEYERAEGQYCIQIYREGKRNLEGLITIENKWLLRVTMSVAKYILYIFW